MPPRWVAIWVGRGADSWMLDSVLRPQPVSGPMVVEGDAVRRGVRTFVADLTRIAQDAEGIDLRSLFARVRATEA